ncbi:MAG: proline racemase family protein [Betaproteobacteria bacterium]|nr:proline racemase family protein [Betaproteobacteria bacterium]
MHNPIATAAAGLQPPLGSNVIRTLDMHTGGEPLRIVVEGLPQLRGRTVLEKRAWFSTHLDHIRTALMWEPRGHADMYGAVVSASETEPGAWDVFFLHNEGYSTMCGHAILALTRWIVESGTVSSGQDTVLFHVPAGRIEARATWRDGVVAHSAFRNVPSFVLHRDAQVEVPGLGVVRLDVAYGGAFYALVDAAPLGLSLAAGNAGAVIDAGRRIKHAVMGSLPVQHPAEPALSFLYGTIFTSPAHTPGRHSRNVCIFADGEVDRSATGSGVSARIALHVARGDVALGQTIEIESITGSTMQVTAIVQTRFGPHEAVIPEVSGSAHYTGRHEFWIDPTDPMRDGFLVR